MKIAILAPLEESIPPKKYGGTELVVYNLLEELVKAKHQVTLLASGDSKVSAKLIPIFKTSVRASIDSGSIQMRDVYKYMGVGKMVTYLSKNKFDIVHNHLGWRVLSFQDVFGCPVVTTLHGPLDVPYQQKVYGEYAKSNFISISLNQRKPMPQLNFVANVYNGIDVDKFKFFPKPKDYFAFLGRMSPEKGPVQAIEIARKAGVKLVMAAKVDLVDMAFFNSKVKPLIDGKQIKFIGEVDHKGKVELLGNAKALIAPIQWEEPFGLFFVEAMATGTPVITMRRGSVPEIVKDKETGFICTTVNQAAQAVKKIEQIDRRTCYDHVGRNFSTKKMAHDYLETYKKVIAGKRK
jgi:glycosyltransferase involved in cell wall biosynthesis